MTGGECVIRGVKISKETGSVIFLAAAAAMAFAANLATGSAGITVREIILFFAGQIPSDTTAGTIILDIRLPRALSAVFGGGALAVSGLLLQTFFRNPLAGPDVLGIASGAGLGAALVILAGPFSQLSLVSSVPAAIAGAFLVTLFLLFLTGKFESMTLTLITGLLAGYFLHSITGILIRFSPAQAARAYINWSAGSFRNISLEEIRIFIPVIALPAALAFVISKQCDLYILGDEYSRSMGLGIKKFRYTVIILTSVMTGAVTSLCGPVSFIGLSAPHFCRFFLKTEKHRLLVPGVFFSGAFLAAAADMIASLPQGGQVLPLNSVTAIIGAPILIRVLLRHRHEK